MTDVKSKNLYELLGNDSDQDSDREPEPPAKVADKPQPRTGKRDAPKVAPSEPQGEAFVAGRGGRGGRRGDFRDSEGDRGAGRTSNRGRPTGTEDGDRQGRNFGQDSRGTRGTRGARRGDRHSRTGITEHVKQADHAWGAQTGEAEFADEKAGEKIAEEELKADGWGASDPAPPAPAIDSAGAEWDGGDAGAPGFQDTAPSGGDGGHGEGAAAAPEAEPEPEDTHKSYDEYLAEQAAKKLEGLGLLAPREANEGSKQDKKWQNAKALARDKEEGYIPGTENKRTRERDRTRNAPEKLEIDYSFKEERGGRGDGRGRGRGRGERGEFRGRGRGRGGDFGDRGDRGDREGGYRGRGDGYRGRGERGEYRGRGRGRGDRGDSGAAPVAVDDESAFPSLGAGRK